MFSGTTIAEVTQGRSALGWLTGRLWIPAVAVRLLAALLLTLGPWTDQPDELIGWDVERFQVIAERDGPAWSERPVEYPPGSVVVFDAIAGESVVETSRSLVVLAMVAELVTVLALWRRIDPRAAKAFLVLGVPLVPMGLVRLDLLVVALATTAAVILVGRPSGPGREGGGIPGPAVAAGLGFGLLVAAGAMVKIWPVLLVAGALALRRWLNAVAAVGLLAISGIVWLFTVGDGLDPIDQVLSLRGATGWHVESVPGAAVALLTDEPARLELNAFRIGTLNPAAVTVGRALAVVVIGLLAAIGAGFWPGRTPTLTTNQPATRSVERLALVVLGSVAALLATAPLLSPQFLLWLTPWAAMLAGSNGEGQDRAITRLVTLVFAVIVLTGSTLVVFGPPNLADTVPAVLLTVRNVGLLAVPVLCLLRLRAEG